MIQLLTKKEDKKAFHSRVKEKSKFSSFNSKEGNKNLRKDKFVIFAFIGLKNLLKVFSAFSIDHCQNLISLITKMSRNASY